MAEVKDFVEIGKPLLIVAGSSNGAMAMAKEAIWKKGAEPVILDPEFKTPEDFRADFDSTNTGSYVIIDSPRRADLETRHTIASLIGDQSRSITVVDSRVSEGLEPEKFSSLSGHFAKF